MQGWEEPAVEDSERGSMSSRAETETEQKKKKTEEEQQQQQQQTATAPTIEARRGRRMAGSDAEAEARQSATTSEATEAERGDDGRAGARDGQMAMAAKGTQRSGERSRWTYVEAERDRAVLIWIGRFRFVTVEVLAERFAVSIQRTRARIRRLEAQGLVQRAPRLPTQAAVLALTPAGARAAGSRRHRAPRPDTHRVHELALAELVCELELADRPGLEILTERDARDREADGTRRYSVDVHDDRGRLAKRWPDVLITSPKTIVAIEVEFAEKGSERLRGILDAYLASGMAEVRFLISSPALAARLKRLAAEQARGMRAFNPQLCAITIHPWRGVTPEDAEKIRARLAA